MGIFIEMFFMHYFLIMASLSPVPLWFSTPSKDAIPYLFLSLSLENRPESKPQKKKKTKITENTHKKTHWPNIYENTKSETV